MKHSTQILNETLTISLLGGIAQILELSFMSSFCQNQRQEKSMI